MVDRPSQLHGEPNPVLRLHPRDNVAIAHADLAAGAVIELAGWQSGSLRLRQPVPAGHKVALASLAEGEPVRRYGQIIGFATRSIQPGDHVHSHNLAVGLLGPDSGREANEPVTWVASDREPRSFWGYRRPDGRVGTRNYVVVLSTINCAAHVGREIARRFQPEGLAVDRSVDGVISLNHHCGCSMAVDGPDYRLLHQTLAGYLNHPNVGGALVVGLGCEQHQTDRLLAHARLESGWHGPLRSLTVQEVGGTRKAIEAGTAMVEDLLSEASAARRTPEPLSELMVALQCGGSDSWSGVTANPLVGRVVDALVAQGGTAVLAETPEIYGAEHLLTRRAISATVGRQLLEKVQWWEARARCLGTSIDNNPTPGNKTGGLTTVYEKALGAVAKGGQAPLVAVYGYGEPVQARGLVFMDSPGYDPASVTGQVAGGCTLVLFTTGRGSVSGFKPAPAIKIASRTGLYQAMAEDMDFNAGAALDGVDPDDLAADLLDLVVEVASGRRSKSERQGFGEEAFSPWSLGEVL